MPPISKFNKNYSSIIVSTTSATPNPTTHSPFRTSLDSQVSRSSQESHISNMSTASEDFATRHFVQEPSKSTNYTHQRNTSSSSTTSQADHNKALPSVPSSSIVRPRGRSITFASDTKPLPNTPKYPHLSKLIDLSRRPQKLRRVPSREGGYVWYAQNCKRIHDQCEAEGVCDLDRGNVRD